MAFNTPLSAPEQQTDRTFIEVCRAADEQQHLAATSPLKPHESSKGGVRSVHTFFLLVSFFVY